MRRRTPRLAAALIVALLVLAACGDDDAEPTTTTAAEVTTTTEGPTTTTSTVASTSTTAAVDEPVVDVALRGDGLGVVDLGAPPDDAVAAVTAVFGEPTVDAGWQSSFGPYGTCPGGQVRGVEWDGLVLLFTDEATDHGTGEHLFAWRLNGTPPALATASGFGLGATTADAEELYPGSVEVVPPEEPFPGFLLIEAEGGRITAFLEGDVVAYLEAGTPCGE